MTDQQIAKWIDQLQGELDVLKRTAGGGSSVSITPAATGGNKVADVTIDGVTTALYAGLSTHFSADEQPVGAWIDGSMIFQKTFDLGSDVSISNSSWYADIVSVADIDKIVDAWGMYSAGTYYPLMAYHTDNNVSVLAARLNADATVRYLTLQYTKTATNNRRRK